MSFDALELQGDWGFLEIRSFNPLIFKSLYIWLFLNYSKLGRSVLPYMVSHRYDWGKSWKHFHRHFDLKSHESKKSVVTVKFLQIVTFAKFVKLFPFRQNGWWNFVKFAILLLRVLDISHISKWHMSSTTEQYCFEAFIRVVTLGDFFLRLKS